MIKNILKKILPPHYIEILKKFRNKFPIIAQRQNKFSKIYSFIHKYTLTKYKINKFYNRNIRNLEIGPGDYRLNNFLTINIVKNRVTDCVVDINKRLPFKDNTFHTIYASHIVEHIFWYKLDKLFSELYRVTAPSGCVEIWVPDGLKIAKAFVDAELKKNTNWLQDGWFRFNDARDCCTWFNGRIFSYGDGFGDRYHYNIHLSCFSERYLKKLFFDAGFSKVERMSHQECRGYDHGWINLGIRGIK